MGRRQRGLARSLRLLALADVGALRWVLPGGGRAGQPGGARMEMQMQGGHSSGLLVGCSGHWLAEPAA